MFRKFTSLLGALSFTTILRKVDKLNQTISDAEGKENKDADCIEDRENDDSSDSFKRVALPRIVVIGDEDSGKSSTLERIAMVEVLPRAKGICTRQPIVLKLRKDERYSFKTPLLKLTINECVVEEQEPLTALRVRTLIADHMKKLAAEGRGIDMDNEIVVEINSDGVPDIDLVDLPGLMAVRVQDEHEPEDLSAQTIKCAQKYLDDPQTGVCVCVVDASIGNLRTSRAIRMVQDVVRPELRECCIGVFAKADKAFDHDWEEEEGADGPLWKLEARLRGEGDIKGIQGLQAGCCAVVNRNTRKKGTVPDLGIQQEAEERWFRQSGISTTHPEGKMFLQLPEAREAEQTGEDEEGEETGGAAEAEAQSIPILSPYGKMHLGLSALLGKIELIFRQHLSKDFIPKKLQEHEKSKSKLAERLNAMGTDPALLTLDDLFHAASTTLSPLFCPSAMDGVAVQTVNNFVGAIPVVEVNSFLFTRVQTMGVWTAWVKDLIAGDSITEHVISLLQQPVVEAFAADTQSDIQLHRFEELREALLRSLVDGIRGNREKFTKAMLTTLESILLMERTDPDGKSGVRITAALQYIIMEMLIKPELDAPGAGHDHTNETYKLPDSESDQNAPPPYATVGVPSSGAKGSGGAKAASAPVSRFLRRAWVHFQGAVPPEAPGVAAMRANLKQNVLLHETIMNELAALDGSKK